MKNLTHIFALLLILPLFTGMKVVYQNETGKIDAIGPFTNFKLQDGQAIIEVPQANPEQITTHMVSNGLYRPKTAEELAVDATKLNQRKSERRTRKRALLTKLGLTKSDITALVELIEDRNDD